MSRHVSLVLVGLICLAAVILAPACGGSGSPSPSPASSEPKPTFETGETIGWAEAAARLDEVRTVEGPVASVTKAGSGGSGALLVNVGLDAPDPARFVIVVPRSVQARYSQPLSGLLDGAFVRVTGRIRQYEGSASITLDSPKDLKIQH